MATKKIPTPDRQRYSDYYSSHLQKRLAWAIAYVHENHPPTAIREHMHVWLRILTECRRPELHPSAVTLISMLHRLPLQWGYWRDWEQALTFAANTTQLPEQKAGLLSELARMMFLTGRRDAALELAKQALPYARSVSALIPLARSGIMVASILLEHKDEQAAAAVLNSVEQDIAEKEVHNKLSIDVATAWSYVASYRARQLRLAGQVDDSLALLNEMVERLALTPKIDAEMLADSYSARSILHWLQGQSLLAIDDLSQAIELVSSAGYESAKNAFRGNLGLCYRTAGKLKEAEETLLSCIQLAEQSHTYYRLAFDMGTLALVFLSQGRIQDALILSERHIALAKDYSSPAENMRALDGYGFIKLHASDYLSAKIALEQNISAYESQTEKIDLIFQLANLSRCYSALGENDQALNAAERAFDYAEHDSYLPTKIITMRALAEIRTPSQSKLLLQQALGLARQCHRLLDEAACILSLAAIEEDESEQKKLWKAGGQILQKVGAGTWLDGCSPLRPPQLPLIL